MTHRYMYHEIDSGRSQTIQGAQQVQTPKLLHHTHMFSSLFRNVHCVSVDDESKGPLSACHAARLHHCCVLLLEPFSYPLVASHVFVDTPHNTRLFSRDQGFCGEIVDAVIEASLDEFGVHRHEFFHLLPLHARVQLSLLCGRETVHDDRS